MTEKDDDTNDDTEVTIESIAISLVGARRELEWHAALVAAAEKGLDEVFDIYGSNISLDPRSEEDIQTWAHRLHMGLESMADVANRMAYQAHLLCQLTDHQDSEEQAH